MTCISTRTSVQIHDRTLVGFFSPIRSWIFRVKRTTRLKIYYLLGKCEWHTMVSYGPLVWMTKASNTHENYCRQFRFVIIISLCVHDLKATVAIVHQFLCPLVAVYTGGRFFPVCWFVCRLVCFFVCLRPTVTLFITIQLLQIATW